MPPQSQYDPLMNMVSTASANNSADIAQSHATTVTVQSLDEYGRYIAHVYGIGELVNDGLKIKTTDYNSTMAICSPEKDGKD
jgi:hypothetical protein